jgi:DnaJ-class molecular chaperone
MERKTYYMILGVSSTESASGIRAAYRDLAKRLHPDVAGEQATRSFQEISEAYAVLSDPERRRRYNDELSRAEHAGVVKLSRTPPQQLDFEVLLEPDEAARGCVVPLAVPVPTLCPRCRGSRHDGRSPCTYCRRQGIVEHEALLRIRIPATTTPSRRTFEVSLQDLGIQDFHLRLHVFVEAPPI